jgi:glycine/D-amino acid oxidase-like deaminating enzyme
LAAARRLAERKPKARIVVLEAGTVGYGAAGRNSGFLYDLPFLFPEDEYRGREDDGRQEIALYRTIIDELRTFVHSGGVDCDWSEIGQYHVAVGSKGEGELARISAGLRNLGERYRTLGSSELKEALGTEYYSAAIHTTGTVQINSLALIRALAEAMPENVEIFEQSPVTRIEDGDHPRLLLNTAIVTAGNVLLTTNTFLRSFIGSPSRLVPLVTFAGLTKPLDEDTAPAGDAQWGVVPAALFGTSMRRLADGRFLVRNTYAYGEDYWGSASWPDRTKERQMLSLQRRFPENDGFELEWSWSGLVSIFRNANGWFGEVAPHIFAATTSGMPLCILYGQQLAEYATGGGDEALAFVRRRSRPGGLPPQPILGYLARLMTSLRQRREWAEV